MDYEWLFSLRYIFRTTTSVAILLGMLFGACDWASADEPDMLIADPVKREAAKAEASKIVLAAVAVVPLELVPHELASWQSRRLERFYQEQSRCVVCIFNLSRLMVSGQATEAERTDLLRYRKAMHRYYDAMESRCTDARWNPLVEMTKEPTMPIRPECIISPPLRRKK